MNLPERLRSVSRVFLDTAPVIYYVEENPRYLARVEPVFSALDDGTLTAVTSPVTLAECVVMPFRFGQSELVAAFRDTITTGENTLFISIDDAIAEKAGDLRTRYGLSLTDTFQIAAALASGCDLFLTNDRDLKQVTEIEVLVLDDLDTRPE
jgi:predicted nucleic acid-binding protein